jgi:hypothetical protein
MTRIVLYRTATSARPGARQGRGDQVAGDRAGEQRRIPVAVNQDCFACSGAAGCDDRHLQASHVDVEGLPERL